MPIPFYGPTITGDCKRNLAMICQGIVPGNYINSFKCISVNVSQDPRSYFHNLPSQYCQHTSLP